MSAKIENLNDIKTFVNAGNSTFTLVSVKSGKRFTFKVSAPSNEGKRDYASNLRFVSVMTGSDNVSDFTYAGTLNITANGIRFSHGKKSRLTSNADSVIAFTWFAKLLNAATGKLESLEVWHEGKCGRCARKLTVPQSIKNGMGPECFGKFEALAA